MRHKIIFLFSFSFFLFLFPFASRSVHAATVTKTWSFTSDTEGLADQANSSWITFSRDSTDAAAKFVAARKSVTNETEYAFNSTTGATWETWGVPSGSTVTNVQITSWQEKTVTFTGATSQTFRAQIINSSGTTVHTAGYLLDVSPGTGTDATYQSPAAGTSRAVGASYQASTTDVRLHLTQIYTAPNATTSVDQRYDNITLTITYTPPKVTISGNIYSVSGGTETICDTSSSTNELSLQAGSTTYTASCDDSTGAYSFSIDPPAAGGIVIWITGLSTKGAAVLYYSGSGSSTNNIFRESTVTVLSVNTTPVTNAMMDTYDSGNAADIPYSVTTNALTVASNINFTVALHSGVATGTLVYSPGGSVTTQGTGVFNVEMNAGANLDTATNSFASDIYVTQGATLTISANTTIAGSLTNNSTGIIASSGTPTITMSGASKYVGGNGSSSGAITVYNLDITGSVTWSNGGANTANNNVSVAAGATLNINTNTTIAGSLTNTTSGIISYSQWTPIITMSGASKTIGGGTTGAITLYDLNVTGSITWTNGGANTVNDNVSVATGATLNLNSNITITGNLTNATSGIIGTTSGTPTISMGGIGVTIGGGTTGAITIYKLAITGGSITWTNGGTNTVNNDVTVAAGGTLNLNSDTTIAGSLTNTTTGVITYSSGTPTLTLSGTSKTLGGGTITGANTFYNLAISGSVTWTNGGTNTVNNNVTVQAGGTFNLNSNVTIAGSLTNATSGIIGTTSGTPTISMGGTAKTIGGGTTGAITIYKLAITGGSITWTNGGTNTVNNDVTVAAGGTLNLNSDTTIAGSLTNATSGIIGTTSGTPTITLTGTSKTLGGGTTGTNTFYNLAISGSVTWTNGGNNNTVNNNVTVQAGGTFNLNSNATIAGSLTNATSGIIGTTSGTPTITLSGTSKTLGGGTTGTITFYILYITGSITFSNGTTTTVSNSLSIDSGATFTANTSLTANRVALYSASVANNLNIGNGATLTVTTSTSIPAASAAVNSTIAVGSGTLTTASIFLTGSATTGQNSILSVSTGTINCSGDITFAGTAAQAQLNFTGNGTLNIQGTLGTGGTITAGTGAINFNGSLAQTVPVYAYYSLKDNNSNASGLSLGGAITVYNLYIGDTYATAKFSDAGYQITGNASGSFTAGAGSSITINTTFPTNFVTANISFNPTSTVTYNSSSAQAVSGVPAYGLLVIDGGSTKTLGASTSAYTLNITSGDAFDIQSFTLTLKGTSGVVLNNTGTFTAGTNSSVIYTGDGALTLLTASTTFYNLVLSPSITADRVYTAGVGFSVNGNLTMNTTASSTTKTVTLTLSGTTTVVGLTDLYGTTTGASALNTGSNQNFSTGSINIRSAGTFVTNSSTINITGTTGTLFTRAGTFTITGTPTVAFNGTGNGINPTLTSGDITFYNLTLNPAISATHSYTFGTGIHTINGDFNITPTTNAYLLTVNMAGNITVAAAKTTTIGGTTATSKLVTGASNPALSTGILSITTQGTLDGTGSTSNITVTAASTPFSVSASNYTVGNTTFIYAPASSSTTTVTSYTYHHLTLNSTSSTFNLTTGGITTNSGGKLYVQAGTLDAVNGSNFPISIGGDFQVSGSFQSRSGVVTFTTTGTANIQGTGNPAITFSSITSSGNTLRFYAGQTFKFNGNINLTNVTLDSSDSSTQWLMYDNGTYSISGITVNRGGCDASSKFINMSEGNTIGSGTSGACWAPPYQAPTPPKSYGLSPIIYWKFDEAQGTTASDSSGNSRPGTLTNSPVWTDSNSCISGSCLLFNHTSNNYVDFSTPLTDILAVSFWINLTSPTSATYNILSLDGPAGSATITANSSGIISVGSGFTNPIIYVNGKVSNQLSLNNWQFVTVTLSGSNLNASEIMVGRVGSGYLDGFIDEFKVYNYTLAPSQIVNQYNSRGTVMGTSVRFGDSQSSFNPSQDEVAYYNFDENTGTSVTDKINANTATLTNGPTWTNGKFGSSANFDGINDYATAADTSAISAGAGVTVTGWVKNDVAFSNTSNTTQGIVDKGDYQFYLDKSDGKAHWVVNDSTSKALSALSSDMYINSNINTLVVFNNELYAGGNFTSVGSGGTACTGCNRIARWTGTAWTNLDQGLGSNVNSLAVFNNELYAGGTFTSVGSGGTACTGCNRIARWTGTAWTNLDQGLGSNVSTLTVFNNELYAGGLFTSVGSGGTACTGCNYVARWTGTAWTNLDAGLANSVTTLVVFNNELYAGGYFSTVGAGGTACTGCNRIARWTGTAWTNLEKGLNNTVYSLIVFNNELYAGGLFTSVGSGGTACTGCNYVARWTGTAWTNLDKGLNSNVNSLIVFNNELYAGGAFTAVGSGGTACVGCNNIARWTGTAWTNLDQGLVISATINSLIVFNNELYAGGAFTAVGSGGTACVGCNNIARWTGTAWTNLDKGLNNTVSTLTVFNNELYAGGAFTAVGSGGTACVGCNRIARWTGTAWTNLDAGLANSVTTLVVFNNELYAGGNFTSVNAGGTACTGCNYVARWTGTAWTNLDQGLGSTVSTLTVFNNELYAGGYFSTVGAGGTACTGCYRIARWTGTAWTNLDGGLNGTVTSLVVFNNELYAGGLFFDTAGGGTACTGCNRIARWTGTAWTNLDKGLNDTVYSLIVFNNELYAGGLFTSVGSGGTACTGCNRIARWTGTAWTNVNFGLYNTVYSLLVSGGKLYIGGYISGVCTTSACTAITLGNVISWSTPNTTSVTGTTSSFPANTWTHFAGTFDGKNLRIFINGKQENMFANTSPYTLNDSTSTLLLGAMHGSLAAGDSDEKLDGSLDDFRIYNRALSPTEISQLYNWAPNSTVYWKFDENTGTSMKDSSGNNISLTADSGNTFPAWSNGKYGAAPLFDGVDNHLNSGQDATYLMRPANNMTISFWVYPTQLASEHGSEMMFLGHTCGSPSWCYYVSSPNSGNTADGIRFNWSNSSSTAYDAYSFNSTGAKLTKNAWNYVTVVRNANSMRTFLNGIDVTTTVGSPGATDTMAQGNNTNTFNVSGQTSDLNRFPGKIDELKIYNYARTPAQIVQDMNASQPAPGSPIGSALVHYKFDEGYGTTFNNSGNVNSPAAATASAALAWSNSGKFGRAISFNGSSTYASTSKQALMASNATTYSNLSWSAWVNPTTSAASKSILIKNNEYKLETDANSKANCAIYSTSWQTAAVSATALPLSTWSHVLCVYDGTTISTYINGKLSGTTTQTGLIMSSNTTGLNLGWNSAGANYFNGLMDDVKVFNTAITPSQALLLYNQSSNAVLGSSTSSGGNYCPPGDTCTSPVAHWKYDENNSVTAYDSSGNGYNLIMNATTKWYPGKFGTAQEAISTHTIGSVYMPPLTSTANFTISTWARIDTHCDNSNAIGSITVDSTHSIEIKESTSAVDGRLLFFLANGTSTYGYADSLFTHGQWFHIEEVYDGSGADNAAKLKIYINGKQIVLTFPGGTVIPNTTADLSTAVFSTGISACGNTKLDETLIYNYSRSASQVAWDYNQGGPVAHYKLNECSGTTANNSVLNGNGQAIGMNGTITPNSGRTAGTTCASGVSTEMRESAGKFNGGLTFDGAADAVTIDANAALNLDTGGTIAAWIYPHNSGEATSGRFLDKSNTTAAGGGYSLFVNTSNNLACFMDGFNTISSSNSLVPYNQWSHVVWTFNGTQQKVYINGKLNNTVTDSRLPPTTSLGVTIGNRQGATDRTFDGTVDDVRLYNYPLNSTQIQTLYNNNSSTRIGL